MIIPVETWRDKIHLSAEAVACEDDDQAAAYLTDALVKLLRYDRAGALATPQRIRRIIAAYQSSGRKIRDIL